MVKDPQKPIQKINLYFESKDNELNNPRRKHPMKFTIKISFNCHLNIPAGTAPIDIYIKLLSLK